MVRKIACWRHHRINGLVVGKDERTSASQEALRSVSL